MPAAVLAAVFPQVVGEPAERVVVGRVVVERALAAGPHHARVDEALEVVAERRGRQVDVRLDVAGGGALRARLHDEAQDRQANRVPERAELLGVMLQLPAHDLLLNYSKYNCQPDCRTSRGTLRP